MTWLTGGRSAKTTGSESSPQEVAENAPNPPPEDEDLVLLCYMSADFREGMDAFLTKRTPVWSGK